MRFHIGLIHTKKPGTDLPGCFCRLIICWGLFIWCFLPSGSLQAADRISGLQNLSASNHGSIEFYTEIVPEKAHRNSIIALKIWGRVHGDAHIYSVYPQGQFAPDPTRFLLKEDFLQAVSDLTESKTTRVEDEAFGETLNVHKNDFWLERQYKIVKPLNAGVHKLTGIVVFQICSERICSLPLSRELRFQLQTVAEEQ